MPDFKAAIFDLDGTLIASTWVWVNMLDDFLKEYNIKVKTDKMIEAAEHMSMEQSSKVICTEAKLDFSPDVIVKFWRDKAYEGYANKVKAKTGAKEYLAYLKDNGVKVGIATACDPILCQAALNSNGLSEYIDVITYVDEVGTDKRSPEVYLECARRLGVEVKDVMLYEDILPGLRSAKSVGMRVTIIADMRSDLTDDTEILKNEADLYIKDYTELLI